MATLFIVAEESAGKTAIAAGIAKRLMGAGKKVGYFRPALSGDWSAPGDAAFMKQVLALPEPGDVLAPVTDSPASVKKAFSRVAEGKDVVIAEVRCGQTAEDSLSKTAYQLAEALQAKVLFIASYSAPLNNVVQTAKGFGKSLIGVVVNKAPQSRQTRIKEEAAPALKSAGIPLLGVIPEDRTLLAITVAELAEAIKGKIVSNEAKSSELVENIMLGAMYVDSGLEYFSRKANKAVILRNDRPDMQSAALETPTRCLVLSGGGEPIRYVRNQAERKTVPIITAPGATATIISQIETALANSRFAQEKKLSRLAELLEKNFDFAALSQSLGL